MALTLLKSTCNCHSLGPLMSAVRRIKAVYHTVIVYRHRPGPVRTQRKIRNGCHLFQPDVPKQHRCFRLAVNIHSLQQHLFCRRIIGPLLFGLRKCADGALDSLTCITVTQCFLGINRQKLRFPQLHSLSLLVDLHIPVYQHTYKSQCYKKRSCHSSTHPLKPATFVPLPQGIIGFFQNCSIQAQQFFIQIPQYLLLRAVRNKSAKGFMLLQYRNTIFGKSGGYLNRDSGFRSSVSYHRDHPVPAVLFNKIPDFPPDPHGFGGFRSTNNNEKVRMIQSREYILRQIIA